MTNRVKTLLEWKKPDSLFPVFHHGSSNFFHNDDFLHGRLLGKEPKGAFLAEVAATGGQKNGPKSR